MSKKHKAHSAKLSLSMIIKNEERFLEGCLESVKGIVDEIIIVDTGSTDRSVEIAQRFGAKIFNFTWIADFSAARNYALQQCTGDWILYLDADERLADNQGVLVRQLITAPGVGTYNVIIENPHSLHQGNFNQENSYPRLFRKLPGVKFEGKVHEQVWPSLVRQKVTIRQSPLVIHHLGYSQGYDVVRQKAERNLELLRAQLAENPSDAYAQFQIGNSLVVLQRYDEAKIALEQAIAYKVLDRTNRASCYNLLAEVEVKRQNFPAAVELCRKSLQLAPRQVMANWFLSLLHFDLREYDSAIADLKNVERLLGTSSAERSNQVASDLDVREDDLRNRFAVTYEAAGNYTEATEQYSHLIDSSHAEEALAGFLRCVERVNDSQAAIDRLISLSESNPERKEFFLPLAIHYRKLNDHTSGLRFIDKTIQSQPENANAYALAARWQTELGNTQEAEKLVARAEKKHLRAFDLHRVGLELSLKKGDVKSAFHHLDLMTQTTDADLSPLRNRLEALALKISS